MIKKLILLVLSVLLVCAQNSSVCDVLRSITIIAQAQAAQLEGHEDFDELKDVVTIDPFLASSSISRHKNILADNSITSAETIFLPANVFESIKPLIELCPAIVLPYGINKLWLLKRSLLI